MTNITPAESTVSGNIIEVDFQSHGTLVGAERCKACGFENAPFQRVCGQCGNPIGTRKHKGKQRYFVTSLEIIHTFHGQNERLSKADRADIREWIFKIAEKAISEGGGHCALFHEDSVVAYFGYPAPSERDVFTAAKAGNAIRSQTKRWNKAIETGFGVTLETHIRLHSDWILAEVGTGQGASSVRFSHGFTMPSFRPGHPAILCSESAMAQLKLQWDVIAHEDIKGDHKWYELRERLSRLDRFSLRKQRCLATFVGRHSERKIVARAWDDVLMGKPQFIALTGEPGIGKSRFIYEMQTICAPMVAAGATLEMGKHPHVVMAGLFSQLLGIHSSDTLSQKIKKIESNLHDTGRLNTLDVCVFCALFGIKPPKRYKGFQRLPEYAETLAVYRAFIVAFTQIRPLTLVVEDLHWADSTFVDMLATIDCETTHAKLMVLVSSREAVHDPDNQMIHLKLPPLWDVEIENILASLVKGTPTPEMVSYMIEKCGGNPLFIEELYGFIKDHDSFVDLKAVPPNIQKFLAMKIGGMGASSDLLKHASILGCTFETEDLKALINWQDDAVDRELENLVEKETIHPDDEACTSYTFHHALVREAAYDIMHGTERRSLHNKVAVRYVKLDRPASMIAHHYSGAWRYVESVDYWLKAAEDIECRRFESYLNSAEKDLKRGLRWRRNKQTYATWDIAPELNIKLKRLKYNTLKKGEILKIRYAYDEIGKTFDKLKVREKLAYLTDRGIFHRLVGEYELATSLLLQAIDLSDREKETVLKYKTDVTRAYCSAALSICHMGKYEGCVDLLDRAEYLTSIWSEKSLRVYYLGYSAVIHQNFEHIDDVIIACEDLFDLLREDKDNYWYTWTKIIYGWALCREGSFSQGFQIMEVYFKKYLEICNVHATHHVYYLFADALTVKEKFVEALSYVEKGLKETEDGFVEYKEKLLCLRKRLGKMILSQKA